MAKINLPEGFTRWKPAKSERQLNGLPRDLTPCNMVEVILFNGALGEALPAINWKWGTELPRGERICGYKKLG